MKAKTSILSNSLIWFGAAVSVAEILTGALIAPLGFKKGILAILLGHLIGCVLLFFVGLIGAKTEKCSMDTVKLSFGKNGSLIFSSLNILQLVGWTAVMIYSGSAAVGSIFELGGNPVRCLIIGALIILWVSLKIKNLNKLNIFAMGALLVLTVVLSTVVFKGSETVITGETISFGGAVELSVAMPLSWLPLISDYTRNAKKPIGATFASVLTYFIVSCWMYVIGLGAALFSGQSDIAMILAQVGLGTVGIVIIIISTVTTTYLDVYSSGVSAESISAKLKEKPVAIAVCIIGTLLAIFTSATDFEGFLYLIGSVFAPMTAVILTDYFICKRDSSKSSFDLPNLIIWLVGLVIYRVFMRIETPFGYTLPAMIITSLIVIISRKLILKSRT